MKNKIQPALQNFSHSDFSDKALTFWQTLGYNTERQNRLADKWMRAGYGKSLRKFLATKTQPLQLIDFGGYQVFESATVDSDILITQNNTTCTDVAICTDVAMQRLYAFHACTIENDFTNKKTA